MGWSPPKFDHKFLWVLLINKAPHIKQAFVNYRKTFAGTSVSTEVAASTEYLCRNQPLTVDVQISKLANFIVDSDIREVVQAGVRTTGGGFLVNTEKQTYSLLRFFHIICASSHQPHCMGCYGKDILLITLAMHLLSLS